MNKMNMLVLSILCLMATMACGEYDTVRAYCSDEMGYKITKSVSGYSLSLHVGPKRSLNCISSSERKMNLYASVKTVEEADRLIAQHRAAFATQVAVK